MEQLNAPVIHQICSSNSVKCSSNSIKHAPVILSNAPVIPLVACEYCSFAVIHVSLLILTCNPVYVYV